MYKIGVDNDRHAFVSVERRGRNDIKEMKVKESVEMEEPVLFYTVSLLSWIFFVISVHALCETHSLF